MQANSIQQMNFNDDDWIEFNPNTLQVVKTYSRRVFQFRATPIVLPNGNHVVKGMRAKSLGLTL